jgi:lipopolysaccharide export system protein LptA
VVLTRGSITIRGDRLELTQDRDGYQYGSVTGSAKEPAFFRQKREGLDEFWEGEAEAVIYNGKADKVLLDKSAVLRRFRGKTKTDEISGAQITYENASEHFSVDGAALPQAGASRTRARVTYEPQTADSPPNTRAPSAPASKTP